MEEKKRIDDSKTLDELIKEGESQDEQEKNENDKPRKGIVKFSHPNS